MRSVLALILIAACGGPSQQQLAETPSATTRAVPAEAPPASTSDKDRERSVQQFDDMQTTQRAYEEAGHAEQAKQKQQSKDAAAQKKKQKAPVEQAPPEPAKKKAPVEQAPKQ